MIEIRLLLAISPTFLVDQLELPICVHLLLKEKVLDLRELVGIRDESLSLLHHEILTSLTAIDDVDMGWLW